jgi:hypothetical protein
VQWPDWSFWDEPWVPAVVYGLVLLGILLIALKFIAPPLARLFAPLDRAPLLWIGAIVAIVGAFGAARGRDELALLAAILGGVALMALYYLGPRLRSLKWREFEVLLAEAQRARSEGNDERFDELSRIVLERIATSPPTGAAAHGGESGEQSPASTPSERNSMAARYQDYEDWVLQQIAEILPAEASIIHAPTDGRPYDADVRYRDRTVAIDIRLGTKFPPSEYLRRMLGDFALRPPADRPNAYLLIVNSPPTTRALDRLTKAINPADLPVVLLIVSLPAPPNTRQADIEELKLALSGVLNF